MEDDNIIDPQAPGHLPVSGEFDANNPMADDSDPLTTSSYDEDVINDSSDDQVATPDGPANPTDNPEDRSL